VRRAASRRSSSSAISCLPGVSVVHFPAGDLGIGFTEQTLQHLLRTRVTEEPLPLPLGGVIR
jgi:hypothetical protein